MSIKITKRGTAPKEKSHKAKCGTCKTEMRFKRNSPGVTLAFDQRDGDFFTFLCPVCGAIVNTREAP